MFFFDPATVSGTEIHPTYYSSNDYENLLPNDAFYKLNLFLFGSCLAQEQLPSQVVAHRFRPGPSNSDIRPGEIDERSWRGVGLTNPPVRLLPGTFLHS